MMVVLVMDPLVVVTVGAVFDDQNDYALGRKICRPT